ncbi:MAG: dephospho-CoA kinase [Chloroflexi bacterium]|nr:dephospho-CoA kinase [Chloroflexota bacterium]
MPTTGATDVHIYEGAAPPALDSPNLRKIFYQANKNRWLMTAEHIAGARFLVREGREIVVERTSADHDDVLRLFLLGSCMGALLFQRGTVPLHGTAVATKRGAVVIAGGIGAGKSTLALTLHQRGYPILADDISAVNRRTDGTPVIESGFPRLKLWADTCRRFAIETDDLPRIRPELEKFHYPLKKGAFCAEPQPLRAVYLLSPTGSVTRPAFEPLTGVAKMKELQAQLYKIPFREARQTWPRLFADVGALARHTRVCLVERPKNGFLLNELADLIEQDLAQ